MLTYKSIKLSIYFQLAKLAVHFYKYKEYLAEFSVQIITAANAKLNENFSMDFDIYSRHTFWSLVIGGFIYWVQAAAVNQTMIQRYLSLPNLKSAKR